MKLKSLLWIVICLFFGLFLSRPIFAQPQVVDPSKFKVELYADFSALSGAPKAFQLTILDKTEGFPQGLYVTTGPLKGTHSDRIIHINAPGKSQVFATGFDSCESMLIAKGDYGKGLLVASPRTQKILRLHNDGKVAANALGKKNTSFGKAPFGVAVLTYGPDNYLYGTDFLGGNLLRIDKNGSAHVFRSIPLSVLGNQNVMRGAKYLRYEESNVFSKGFIVSTFTVQDKDPNGQDAIYSISSDGKDISLIRGGLSGVEMLTIGPGGEFGFDLYIATIGSNQASDGVVYTLSKDGKLKPFLTGIDAVHVIFDTKGILGGGMFVSDFNNDPDNPVTLAGKVWRITNIK